MTSGEHGASCQSALLEVMAPLMRVSSRDGPPVEAAPTQRVPQAAPWVLWWVLPLEPPLAWRDGLGGPWAGVRGRRSGGGQEGRLGYTP